MTIKVRINGDRFCQLKKNELKKYQIALEKLYDFTRTAKRKPTKNERKTLLGNVRARELREVTPTDMDVGGGFWPKPWELHLPELNTV